MARIVPGIDSLEQHLKQLQHDPEVYRPNCCPHCGKSGVHRHGHYDRNTPRGTGLALSLGPLRILRFFCSTCRRTCSRLPACLAPWRQYLWSVQQVVLEWLLAGGTLRQAARRYSPSRRTIGRWWQWLKARFEEQSFHLRSRFPVGSHGELARLLVKLPATNALVRGDGVAGSRRGGRSVMN